jgi:hypothetical protein
LYQITGKAKTWVDIWNQSQEDMQDGCNMINISITGQGFLQREDGGDKPSSPQMTQRGISSLNLVFWRKQFLVLN